MNNLLNLIFTLTIFIIVFACGTLIVLLQIPRHIILKKLTIKDYFESVVLGLDSFAGSVIYGKRGAYFYVSSIAYYDAIICDKNLWFMKLIDTIFFFEKEHCKNSFLKEAKKFNLVPDLDDEGNLKRWMF